MHALAPTATQATAATKATVATAASREAAAMLVLLNTGRHSPARYADIVQARGSALRVLQTERLEAARQTSFFADPEEALIEELAQAERDIVRWQAHGHQVLTILDPRYPANLRDTSNRPPLLFVGGRSKPGDARAVAVVGPRAPTRAGLQLTTRLAAQLNARGYTVVSGLEPGIETTALTAAIRRSGRAVAVLATGLSRSYPSSNVVLQRRIAAQCAVMSQFLPDVKASPQTLAGRQAVISGLALATVIVEASARGGARMQARRALEHGRPLFLLGAALDQPSLRRLAGDANVYAVTHPDEVVDTLEHSLQFERAAA